MFGGSKEEDPRTTIGFNSSVVILGILSYGSGVSYVVAYVVFLLPLFGVANIVVILL